MHYIHYSLIRKKKSILFILKSILITEIITASEIVTTFYPNNFSVFSIFSHQTLTSQLASLPPVVRVYPKFVSEENLCQRFTYFHVNTQQQTKKILSKLDVFKKKEAERDIFNYLLFQEKIVIAEGGLKTFSSLIVVVETLN